MRLSTALTALLILSSSDDVASAEQRKLVVTKEIDGECGEETPCGVCEGDCDEDIDCKDGLKCFERKKNDNKNGRPDEVPGCELGEDDRPDVDYCYDPTLEEDKKEGEEAEFAVVGDEMKGEDAISVPDIKDFDVTKCGGIITKRAQECGGSRNTPEKCCPGYICEGKDSVRCTVDPEAPITASVKPAAIRRPTPSPTRLADKKPRTWNTLMPEYILREEIIKLEARSIQRMIALERDAFKFTENPSAAPSASPTFFPTAAPTRLRKDECKIEMYYEKKFCWHDDGRNSKCNYDYEVCIEGKGEDLEVVKCKDSPDSWQVIGHTVRPKNDKKSCWTRRGDSGIRVMECDEEGEGKWADQQFEGVCMKKPHMIRPLSDKKWCLTSGHEPRQEERLKFQECDKVDNSNTHLWIEK